MATVSLENLQKRYGRQTVIPDVNLEIEDGEFIALVGPSGCGKSTLLRMIAGLETISGGIIRIDGEEVNDVPPKERDIAMVFQNYALYPHMTVRENMRFSLKLRGEAKQSSMPKVEDAAKILNLSDYLERLPKQLSGGQRQRVAMGRAIVRQPEVFLFDEPLSNLDAKLRVTMRSEIKALHKRLQTTTIYVTHDQIEAMTMADRIVVLQGGVIEQVGTPIELYERPVSRFVAGFIGSPSMNFLSGKLVASGDTHAVAIGSETPLPLAGRVTEDLVGQTVTVGIRPEHFVMVSGGEPALRARVDLVEPTGSETHVVVDIGDDQHMITVRDRTRIVSDQMLNLSAEARDIHLFDEAGRRIEVVAEGAALADAI